LLRIGFLRPWQQAFCEPVPLAKTLAQKILLAVNGNHETADFNPLVNQE
jgi:hypothetical protein